MKLLKKMLKQEKGAITMTVLAAMIFMTTILVISYFSIFNLGSNQNRKIQQISKQYSVTDGELEGRYNQILRKLDNTSYIQINEIKNLGNIMLSKKTNTETTDTDGNNVIIPGGFKLADEENTDRVEEGLVIEDKDENQWVWIPVSSEDLSTMYTEDSNGWIMSGTTGTDEVITKLKTTGMKNRGNPGTKDYREPDMLDETDLDNNSANLGMAGFTTYKNMAESLRDDYKNMLESLSSNGGFYIGRYEIGTNGSIPQLKKGTVMNNTNWYNLYSACKTFSTPNIEARMIWGCQWDQVCRFIKGDGEDSIINHSNSYGNYVDSTRSINISGSSNFNNTTGRSEDWKIKNIYDIAGNCIEWTQEANQSRYRVCRGGSYLLFGNEYPVTYIGGRSPKDDDCSFLSSRPTFYIK